MSLPRCLFLTGITRNQNFRWVCGLPKDTLCNFLVANTVFCENEAQVSLREGDIPLASHPPAIDHLEHSSVSRRNLCPWWLCGHHASYGLAPLLCEDREGPVFLKPLLLRVRVIAQ